MVRVVQIHFGVVLGCKGGGGYFFLVPKSFLRCSACIPYSTMPGLESLFVWY